VPEGAVRRQPMSTSRAAGWRRARRGVASGSGAIGPRDRRPYGRRSLGAPRSCAGLYFFASARPHNPACTRSSRVTSRSLSRTVGGAAADSGTKKTSRQDHQLRHFIPGPTPTGRVASDGERPSHATCAIRARARIWAMQPGWRSSFRCPLCRAWWSGSLSRRSLRDRPPKRRNEHHLRRRASDHGRTARVCGHIR
jgi:hypothetical protein